MEKEVLKAELEYVSVVEILYFLTINKKTGKLRVKSNEEGEIYIEDGKCTHAKFKDLEGIDAIFELSLLKEGYISFYPNEFPPKKTISGEMGKLFEEVERRSKEIRDIEKNIPPLDAILLKSDKAPDQTLKLRKNDWKILSLIDGKRKLREVIAESGIGLFEAYRSIYFLTSKGLLIDPEEGKRKANKVLKILNEFVDEYSKESLELRKSCANFIKTVLKSAGFKEIDENIDFNESKNELNFKKEMIIENEKYKKIIEAILPPIEKKFALDFGTILGKRKFENFKKKIEV